MLKITLLTLCTLASVYCYGDFAILHSPETVYFKGVDPVNQTQLKEVFTGILGYTVNKRHQWQGVEIIDPFHPPEAVVSIVVEGVDFLDSPSGQRFPLIVDEEEETTWQAVSRRIGKRDNNNTLVRIRVGDGINALGHSALGALKPNPIDESTVKFLDLKIDEDRKFIEEIQLLRAIAENVLSTVIPNGKPDIYWLVVPGLHPVIELHGKTSRAVQEAFNLLNSVLDDISNDFIKVYNGDVVIAAFTNDANKVRNTRSADTLRVRRAEPVTTESSSSSEKPSDPTSSPATLISLKDVNLAKKYSANYPVIFNIFLWFSIIFVFSLIAICIAIADMDPGRDSIIYRMTSNRMKKDN